MPKARRLGNYLKAVDIGGKGGTAIVRMETEGERAEPSEYRPDGALEIPVTPVNPQNWTTGGAEPKTWSLNRTSENTALDYIGENTEDWAGKTIRVNVLTQNVRGTIRDILYSEAPESQEQPKTVAPTTTPKAQPAAVPAPATVEAIAFTEAAKIWIKYNELSIGKILDPQDWQMMPKGVKASLQEKGVLYDKDGYPYLDDSARKALE